MIVREIYYKPDNGSRSKWLPWPTGKLEQDHLYSCGEAYLHTSYTEKGWVLKYRPYFVNLSLPSFFGEGLTYEQALWAIVEFSEWVVSNRRDIVAQLESYEC